MKDEIQARFACYGSIGVAVIYILVMLFLPYVNK